MNNVKPYIEEQLLAKVKSLPTFKKIPDNYWAIFVRSNENASNVFDDKVYFFKGEESQTVTSCTTSSGTYGLLNFTKWNKKGTAVLASNIWYYNTWSNGKHKGKMDAWVQNLEKVLVYRDNNKNDKAEQIGTPEWGFFGINIHTVSYKIVDIVKNFIGGWSVGCLVLNNTKKYREILKEIQSYQNSLTAVLIDEF